MLNQMKIPGCIGNGFKTTTVRILAASILVTGLTGCGHRFDRMEVTSEIERAPLKTAEQRNPIEIEKARATLALNVPGNSGGLNDYQKDRVRHFIAVWRNEGAGKIMVSGNNRGALEDLRDLLIERVVPVGAVQVLGYDANQPGVKLSFARYVAEGPACGKFNTNLAEDSKNTEYGNFGCAAQHNMAALIANPKDLITPRDQTDWTDANRRDFMYRAWLTGRNTAGDTTTTNKAGTISDVAAH